MSDLRFAIRMLMRAPAFTAVAVATLALGIGANTAIFTLFNAILLQALPVRDPGRLVLFSPTISTGTDVGSPPANRWDEFSVEVYDYLRNQRLPFEGMTAVRSGDSALSVRLPDARQAERAQGQLVAGSYFRVIGADAMLGRTLTENDDRRTVPPTAVVSYGFWRDRLHANPSAVGTTVNVNGAAYAIVGVMPSEFFGERIRRSPDFWIPLSFQPEIEMRPSYLDQTNAYWLSLIGRLAPGATRAQAQTATIVALQQFLTNAAGDTIGDARRKQIREARLEFVDGANGLSGLRYRYSQPLRVLLVVVGLVLLIACANVGNLLLARAAARETEISVRMALGATRGRLLRQLMTESLLLAALGAGAGVLLARWVVSAIMVLIASNASPVHATLDRRVLAFTLGVACLSGVLFGLVPGLAARRRDLAAAMKARGHVASGGGGVGVMRALVVAQIATSLVLLVGATLFARSLVNLETQPLGFDPEHVLVARVNPRLAGYKPAEVGALYRRLYDRVNALAGVTSATLARYSPLGGSRSAHSGVIEGYTPKAGENIELESIIVGPSYPATLGMTLVRGRAIGVQDAANTAKVGMVNEAFVRKYLANEDPIGHRFGVNSPRNEADTEIVGVLKDARFRASGDPIEPIVFVPFQQDQTQLALDCEVEIRTAGDPAAAAGQLRQAILEVDSNLPMNDPRLLRDQVATNFDSQRLAARLVGFFGGLALLLAAVGLYGVISQGVSRRTSEIGVRMALGAARYVVLWMILRDTLVLLAVGLAIGVPAAIGAAHLVASQLYGFSPSAPGPFVAAAVALALVSVVTGLVPAFRASRVDPMVALRYE